MIAAKPFHFTLAPRLVSRHKSDMNTRIVTALVVLVSSVVLFAQAEKVKGKAKDLKKSIEAKQTNQVNKATPPKK